MKAKGGYEIHALIGRCHLHSKKKCTYSIGLKLGSKSMVSTEYKTPVEEEINFNTELILKVDRTQFESGAKLWVTVVMQGEDKEKKALGSVEANYKERGVRSLKLGACSCREKGFEVSVEFEVVSIQNQTNNQHNQHNNKFQTGSNASMKDFKKALTISRENQLAKTSRAKLSAATKSPPQKTQPKLHKPKPQHRIKTQLSPDLSSLTTKISPQAPKSLEESKPIIAQLRNQISQLQVTVTDGLAQLKIARRENGLLHSQVNLLHKQNQCLMEILAFEQQKSSAALEYITYLGHNITSASPSDHTRHYLSLIQSITNDHSQTSLQIKAHRQSNSFLLITSIDQRDEQVEQLMQETVKCDNCREREEKVQRMIELGLKLEEVERQCKEKDLLLTSLENKLIQAELHNDNLSARIQQIQHLLADYQTQLVALKHLNTQLHSKQHHLQSQLTEALTQTQNLNRQHQQLTQTHAQTLIHTIQQQQKINQLHQTLSHFQQLQQNYQHARAELLQIQTNPKPITPTESQITIKRTRFDDGQDLGNLIQQMNLQIYNRQTLDNDIQLQVKNSADCPLETLSHQTHSHQTSSFLTRNKSESLLKDLQHIESSQSDSKPPSNSTPSKQTRPSSCNKINIPEHKKLVQKYNYDYDIDSLNYFNNFQASNEIMQMAQRIQLAEERIYSPQIIQMIVSDESPSSEMENDCRPIY